MIELAPGEHLSGAQWIQPTDNDGFQVVWFFSTGKKALWLCTGHTRGSRPAAHASHLKPAPSCLDLALEDGTYSRYGL